MRADAVRRPTISGEHPPEGVLASAHLGAKARPRGARGRDPLDQSIASRLRQACDEHLDAPAYNHGRQTWVRAQLADRFGVPVSSETVSKWFTGAARPRPDKINALSRLLEVDEAWLALGISPQKEQREAKIRNAMADGVVNVLAGFIQLSGGHPAFPDPNQTDTAPVDLYAIIRGAHYALQVELAEQEGGAAFRFQLSRDREDRIVVGVIQRGPLACEFIELSAEMIERHGARRGGALEITVTREGDRYVTAGEVWPQIESFAQRL